ncbi:glycoside hydrolase family 2 protein [Pedobacter alluvionis]|uniref:Beta-galactosidase n=1 Tax=Pedobacter alluvionis TaxID=475253 RepID=A0A497YDY0_9SPHI|nr:sugar-binding domain-containing protein [Pedobacter alluvionis]RLJ79669.1 glycosyl hydrolase family 2 [Pedobacter alluvionis]TFB30995.1 beta-galactosidase [Pedobacter alluvionis]
MNKKVSIFLSLLGLSLSLSAQQQDKSWSMVKGKISSPWAQEVNPKNVLPEYPRPQLERTGNWKNLNGLWDYAISGKSQRPVINQGKILVPFAVESALSGVGKTVGKDSLLWYKTVFTVPSNMKGKEVLLHFGAVDWRSTVSINGKEVGKHEGGFDPFSFNITPFLNKSGNQTLTVEVWDPTDEGPQPRGKQVKRPEGIWYTPVTGIWQTVWIEAVNKSHIDHIKVTPDIDQQSLAVTPVLKGAASGDQVKVSAWDGTTKVAEQTGDGSGTITLKIANPKLWSPKSPFLYDLKVELLGKNEKVDEVKSYFAMRKSSIGKDQNGIQRMLLNNEFVFQYGPLDQGWWPDGLYTAPTDAALKFDVDKTKEMGFNMIRKHIKVEPARWYYYCDKAGMLVWQDMPSGDLGNGWENRPGILDHGSDKNRTAESEGYYKKEWNAIIDALYNVPSIVVWTPFNEAWGQFKTVEIAKWTKEKDPSRLVNTASGGNFHPVGDIIDLHNYPHPAMPSPDYFGKDYALVLGEFGGLGLPVDGHVWQQKNNWGYQSFKNKTDLFNKYAEFAKRLEELIPLGLSAGVYTQTTDVEVETNGLMTYDRKDIKFSEAQMKALHDKLYQINVPVQK